MTMIGSDGVRELAALLIAPGKPEPPLLRQGVVESIGSGSVGIYLSGSNFAIGNVKYISGYSPSIGDVVWMLKNGPDLLVIGRVSESSQHDSHPSGSLIHTIAAAAPPGWLLMNGQAIADADVTYPGLWSVAPAGWKSGSTLTLPDWRGRTLLGAGQGSGLTNRVLGSVGGSEDHTLTLAQIPAHNHGTGGGHAHTGSIAGSDAGFIIANGSGGTGLLAGTHASVIQRTRAVGATQSGDGTHTHTTQGSGSAHPIMQPWAAANIIVKT